jgi:hypothetical protein
MKSRHAAALALLVLGTLSACSPVEHHTDKQAAMANITYTPEKCENEGNVYDCSSEHALPGANVGIPASGTSSDVTLLRGICQQGFHYETGGCQKDSAAQSGH